MVTLFRVSAINLKQVKIVFSKEVESTTAQSTANYKVGDTLLSTIGGNSAVKLLSDKKTAIMTIDQVYAQGTVKNVKVIGDAIQEKDTGLLCPTYNQDVTFSDTTAPTVTGVKVSGNKSIKVTFSEAVNTTAWSNASYKLDGANLSAFGGSASMVTGYYGGATLSNQVQITFAAPLAAGSHTLTVGASDSNPITDTASFKLVKADQTFSVNNVTAEPTVQSITANSNTGKITVVFSEEMDLSSFDNDSAFNVNSTSGLNGTLDSDDSTNKTVIIQGGAAVVEGANILEIVPNQVKDVYGNYIAPDATNNVRLSFTATKDASAPVLEGLYPISETVFRAVFSEAIDPVYLTNTNFVLKNTDGDTILGGTSASKAWTNLAIGSDPNTVNLTTTAAKAATLGKAQYTLTVQNVADLGGNIMPTASKSFTTIDSTDPSLLLDSAGNRAAGDLLVNSTKRTAQVLFNEPMDAGSIGNLSNYLLAKTGTTFDAITSSASISVASDNKSVTITWPDTENVASWSGAKVRVLGVKDVAGNTISGGVMDTMAQQLASAYNNPAVDAFKVYSNSSKIWATIDTDQTIDSINSNADFGFNAGGNIIPGGTYAPDSVTRVGTQLTLTWYKSTGAGAAYNAILAAGENVNLPAGTTYTNIVNVDGAGLKIGTSAKYADDMAAPKISTVEYATANTVVVTFNEVMKNAPALYADDFTIVKDGVVVPTDHVTATLDGTAKILTLTLASPYNTTAANVIVKLKAAVDLADTSDNLFVPTTDQINGTITVTNSVAPALLTAATNAVVAYEGLVLTSDAAIATALADNGTAATAAIASAAAAGNNTAALTGRVTAKTALVVAAATPTQVTVAGANIGNGAGTASTMVATVKNAAGVTLSTVLAGPYAVTYAWTVTGATDTVNTVGVAVVGDLALTNATAATVNIAKAPAGDATDTYTLNVVVTPTTGSAFNANGTLTVN